MSCDECDDLRARIRDLESQLGLHQDREIALMLQSALKLEPAQALMVVSLYKSRKAVSHGTLADSGRGYLEGSVPAVKVHMVRIRRKLGKEAITVVHGYGYQLTEEAREKIRGLLGSRINVNAITDDEDASIPTAIAILAGRLAEGSGFATALRILSNVQLALHRQHGVAHDTRMDREGRAHGDARS